MNFRALRLLADENFDPLLIQRLVDAGMDVVDAQQSGTRSRPDVEVMCTATSADRAVITHDADFGSLAFVQQVPSRGVVFVRPGHIDASFHFPTIDALLDLELVSTEPLMIVATRTSNAILVRQRPIKPLA